MLLKEERLMLGLFEASRAVGLTEDVLLGANLPVVVLSLFCQQ